MNVQRAASVTHRGEGRWTGTLSIVQDSTDILELDLDRYPVKTMRVVDFGRDGIHHVLVHSHPDSPDDGFIIDEEATFTSTVLAVKPFHTEVP